MIPALFVVVTTFILAAHTPPRTISFPTADGGVVYADEYGSGDHVVVLAHGGRFTKESWSEQAPVIEEAGHRVIAIDFRGRGRSRGGARDSTGEDLYLDVLAAVRYARESGAERVSLIGASLGGWAAARAACVDDNSIDDLILLAHPPIDTPEQMNGRKLFVTARDDTDGRGVKRLVSIRDQYERAPGPKQLVLLEGSAHAQFIFETDEGERLMQLILDFLGDTTKAPE